MKAVLITGVSSGTGLGLTDKFINEGYKVVGTVRTLEKAKELQILFGRAFSPLVFDITDPMQIASASKKLTNELGIKYLSAIVNNAGSAEIGPLLHVSTEEFKAQLNVLVVGQLSVIQNFYRLLIPQEADQATGRIINITSVSGVWPNYLFGCYAAGKHALEGLSKTLREECSIYGIKVIVVAPGNIATAIWDKQTEEIAEKYRNTDYYSSIQDKIGNIVSDVVKNAMSVAEFSNAFYSVFEDSSPSNRYTITKSKSNRLPFGTAKVRVTRS